MLDRANDGREEGEELGVGVRGLARLEQVLAVVRGHRPVVVLARAVDALEGLLVQKRGQAVLERELLHEAHEQHVVVRAHRGGLEHGRELELSRRDLVVAGLGGNAHAPQLTVEVHHERQDALADGAEILVLELLALGRGRAEERAAGEDQVRAELGETTIDQEVLLLGTDGGEDALGGGVAEPA